MPDVPSDFDDDAINRHLATQVIGEKVLEMIDRLKVTHACAPGAQASWGLTVDGVRFALVMRVTPAVVAH